MRYLPNQYINPALTIRDREMDTAMAEPYDPRPLTPKEVEEKQRKNKPGSPYLPGKSPIPSKNVMRKNDMTIASNRFVGDFLNIDDLEDPIGAMRDSGYGDPDVMDFPSGGNYRKGSDVLDRLIDLELVKGKRNQNMTIAGAQDLGTKQFILRNGMFVDENQIKYLWSPRQQKFIDMGPYDPYYDGLPIPLGQRNTDMKIAKKNKRKSQKAYEDFVKDSGSQPLDEQLMDMDKGRMGGGLDILDRLFPRA